MTAALVSPLQRPLALAMALIVGLGGLAFTSAAPVRADDVLTIGEVQGETLSSEDGRADTSPYAGQTVDVRGVVTQRLRFATSSGGTNYGFFLQSTTADADGNPLTSDGIFVFHGRFSDLRVVGGGFYTPEIGDQVVLTGRVVEFFNLTQLSSPFVASVEGQVDVESQVETTVANPPDDLADAYRYWERLEGMLVHVPAGAVVTGSRDVFSSTHDGEVWVVRGDHPLAERSDPYARRVFRDAHPLDDIGAAGSFDNGNGMRMLLVSHGLKWNESSNTALIAPARTFDTVMNAVTGGVYYSFGKYGIEITEQLELGPGADAADNARPAAPQRTVEYSTAIYNVENLYDFRDDPFDGCDFAGNAGCPGVRPPFNYVPESHAAYEAHLTGLADQIANDLHGPDILLIQEAEDQDICTVSDGALACGATEDADGKPDTLQELALLLGAQHGLPYDAAYDRDGADDRGIVNGFLYRTDRVELLAPDESHPVLGSEPQIAYDGAALDYNAEVENPKALNAVLPAGVELGDGCQAFKEPAGRCVFTRDAQVGYFRVWRDGIGTSVFTDLYAISNHFSSTPDRRIPQRTEQAAYNAAIVEALGSAEDGSRVLVGGDFNVFPRPDDPVPPSDQLGALYGAGLNDLWAVVVAEAPSSAYSYVFEGQAQTLDNQFATGALFEELSGVRYAHVNADFPAAYSGDGSRGSSDHDPQAARFGTLPTLERLLDLVDYYVVAGLVTEDVGDAITDRLSAALQTHSRAARDRQLDELETFVQRHTPRHVDVAASQALLAELELFRSLLD